MKRNILASLGMGLFMAAVALLLARPVSRAQTPPLQPVVFQPVFSTSRPVVAVHSNKDVQLIMADTGWSALFSQDDRGTVWNIPNWEPVPSCNLVRVGDWWYCPSPQQVWRVVDGELRRVYSDSTGYGYDIEYFGDRWGAYVRVYTQAIVITITNDVPVPVYTVTVDLPYASVAGGNGCIAHVVDAPEGFKPCVSCPGEETRCLPLVSLYDLEVSIIPGENPLLMVVHGSRVGVYNMLTFAQEFSGELPAYTEYTPIGRYLVNPWSSAFAYDADNHRLVPVPFIPGVVKRVDENGALYSIDSSDWRWIYPTDDGQYAVQSLSRYNAFAGPEGMMWWAGWNGVWRYSLDTGEMWWVDAHTTTLETTYDGYGVYLNTPEHMIAVTSTGVITLSSPGEQSRILGWVGNNIYVKEELEGFGYVISACTLSTVAWNGSGWDTIQSLRITGPWGNWDFHREKIGNILVVFSSDPPTVYLFQFGPDGQFSHQLFDFSDQFSGAILYPVVPAENGDFLMTVHSSNSAPRVFWVDGGSGATTQLPSKYEWGAGFTDYGHALVEWYDWKNRRYYLTAVGRDGTVYGEVGLRRSPYYYRVWRGMIVMGGDAGIDVYRIAPPYRVYLPLVMRGR